MKSNNSVAVSIPIHNWTPYLKAVLGSLKVQSAQLEIAVMMTHEDPRILEDLNNSGLKFHYTRIGPDKGQAAAIAEGWENTQSPVLAWLNTDDVLTGNILPTIISAFNETPNLDVIYGHSTISNEKGTIVGRHPAVHSISPLLRRTNIISQPSCFFRRRAVTAVGGLNQKLQFTMDWDLWLRLFENDSRFLFSDHIFSNVTWAQQTKTASLNWQRLREFGMILRRTQSLYKTTVGLSAIIRENRSTYKSNQDITENCLTLNATPQPMTLPVVNMHMDSKFELEIDHEEKDITVVIDAVEAEIITNRHQTKIKFAKAKNQEKPLY